MYLDKFNEFMIDSILESVFNKEMDFYMSYDLISLIKTIDHPISKSLLLDDKYKNKKKCTFVNLDNSSLDAVSFLTPSKAAEIMTGNKSIDIQTNLSSQYINSKTFLIYDDLFFSKKKSVTTIGRLIIKLYGNKFPVSGSYDSIETFVDKFKSMRDISYIKEVKGENINKYYLSVNYIKGGGSLNNSCMRYSDCEKYIDFYSKNDHKVSLLILLDNDNPELIKGRALLWKLDIPNGRYFMDRIYTVYQHDVMLFINYAIKNNYLYKDYQNSDSNELLVDPITKDKTRIKMSVLNIEENDYYPYMDTLKYYDIKKGILSNNMSGKTLTYKLEDVDGGYTILNDEIYIDYYGDYICEDDLIYCYFGNDFRLKDDVIYIEYYNQYATEEFVNEKMITCDYCNDSPYRFERDTVRLINGKIACEDYDGIVYSEYLNEYILTKDVVFSKYHNSNLYKPNAVKVFTNIIGNETDWRDKSDSTWWTWNVNNENYDNDIKKEMLEKFNNK